jgi:hypothetical protein
MMCVRHFTVVLLFLFAGVTCVRVSILMWPVVGICSVCELLIYCMYICPVSHYVLDVIWSVVICSYGLNVFFKSCFKSSSCLSDIFKWLFVTVQLADSTRIEYVQHPSLSHSHVTKITSPPHYQQHLLT